jgi:prepilin-type N-terminal cleavage/methylation domain-containing protein
MKRTHRQGFTLLEVMVATTIMAVAVVALLGGLTQSTTNAAKLREREIVVALAKQQLNAILLEPRLPHVRPLEGVWEPRQLGPGMRAGWTARLAPMMFTSPVVPPPPGIRARMELTPLPLELVPGPMTALDRVIFEAWWTSDSGKRRTFTIETYKRNWLVPGE